MYTTRGRSQGSTQPLGNGTHVIHISFKCHWGNFSFVHQETILGVTIDARVCVVIFPPGTHHDSNVRLHVLIFLARLLSCFHQIWINGNELQVCFCFVFFLKKETFMITWLIWGISAWDIYLSLRLSSPPFSPINKIDFQMSSCLSWRAIWHWLLCPFVVIFWNGSGSKLI